MLVALSIAITLLAWFWPKFWYKVVKDKISVNLKLSRRYAPAGTAAALECELLNRSWLPCPSIEVVVELPEGLSKYLDHEETRLRFRTYLLPRQAVRLRAQFYTKSRGFKVFRKPVLLHLNEGLGLTTFIQSHEAAAEMVVLPAFIDDVMQTPKTQSITGNLEVFRWLHPDETLYRGVRSYQFGDAPKHISWRASAATGQWMVKQYMSSTEPTVSLLLNAQFFEPYWNGTRRDEFEALCSLAVTYAAQLESKGYRITFVSNALIPRDPLRQFHGQQSAMGIRLLLGRADPYANVDFGVLWRRFRVNANQHSPVLVITSHLTTLQQGMILDRSSGLEVFLIPGPNPEFPGGRNTVGVKTDSRNTDNRFSDTRFTHN